MLYLCHVIAIFVVSAAIAIFDVVIEAAAAPAPGAVVAAVADAAVADAAVDVASVLFVPSDGD